MAVKARVTKQEKSNNHANVYIISKNTYVKCRTKFPSNQTNGTFATD